MPLRRCLPILLCTSLLLLGSHPPASSYRFPFDELFALSGTFGELRSNHFHSGLDIKTYGEVGIPVRAIADGYVYRLRSGPTGYGTAVYLRHHDGQFSVYAHLQRMAPALEAHQQARQQAERQAAIDSYLAPSQLPVQQGDIIGYSGNSGSSQGPHLHFEIRDARERILNPLAHYRAQIPDHRPPIVQEIALQPIDYRSRIEGVHEMRRYPLRGSNGRYELGQTIPVRGPVGLAYRAYDLLDAASNHCGINYAELSLDGQLIHRFALDTFAFDETRYLNLHIDYGHKLETNQRLERAYQVDGNRLSAYGSPLRQGVIELTDDSLHHFALRLRDSHGNETEVKGTLQRDTAYVAFVGELRPLPAPQLTYQLDPELLKLTVTGPPAHWLTEGLQYDNDLGQTRRWPAAYLRDNQAVFLLPLDRYDYPRRIRDDSGWVAVEIPLVEEIRPDRNNLAELRDVQAFFPFDAVFRPLHLTLSQAPRQPGMYSEVYHIGQPEEPIYRDYVVSITPSVLRQGLVVAYWDGREWDFAGSQRGPDGSIRAQVNDFGAFCLMADTIPPELRPINFGAGSYIGAKGQLSMRVRDEFSGIDYQRIDAFIGSEWICFEYDNKQARILADMSRYDISAGEDTLRVRVVDGAGNVSTFRCGLRF
jgi:hypothetical protein